MGNRLERSRADTMIGGVCGGLAKYLQVDSSFVRLFFVLLGLAGNGMGLFIYILLWILLPIEGQQEAASLEENVRTGSQEIADKAREMGEDLRSAISRPNPKAGIFIGGGLIILGLVYLIQNLNFPWLYWLDFDVIWPILLVMAGIALLRKYYGDKS